MGHANFEQLAKKLSGQGFYRISTDSFQDSTNISQDFYRTFTEIRQHHIYRDSSRKVSKVLQAIYRENTEFKNLQEFYRDSTGNIFRWDVFQISAARKGGQRTEKITPSFL